MEEIEYYYDYLFLISECDVLIVFYPEFVYKLL